MAAIVGTEVVESWGPGAFSRRFRAKLQSTAVDVPRRLLEKEDAAALPKGFNILLIGPTGAGKSSLIYTWWRALTGKTGRRSSYLASFAHASLLRRLQVGWTVDDAADDGKDGERRSAALSAAARHGTTALTAFELQPAADGCGHIQVHDTKGQQFFTEDEEQFATSALEGKLLPGSSPEEMHWRYWISIGAFGVFVTSDLASAPHALVLVFDATLRSFHTVLADAASGDHEENELAACYRRVLERARKEGQPVMAVLTHVDGVEVHSEKAAAEAADGEGSDSESDEEDEIAELCTGPRHVVLERFKELLGVAIGIGAADVFCVENYRQEKHEQDAEIDFRALEALDSAVTKANAYIAERVRAEEGYSCAVS